MVLVLKKKRFLGLIMFLLHHKSYYFMSFNTVGTHRRSDFLPFTLMGSNEQLGLGSPSKITWTSLFFLTLDKMLIVVHHTGSLGEL